MLLRHSVSFCSRVGRGEVAMVAVYRLAVLTAEAGEKYSRVTAGGEEGIAPLELMAVLPFPIADECGWFEGVALLGMLRSPGCRGVKTKPMVLV